MRASALLLLALSLPTVAAGATGNWQRGAPLPLARGEVAAAVDQGRIFIIGGFTSAGANSTSVQAFNPPTNSWAQEADLPLPVDHAMAAGYRGRVYVAGGYGPGRARLTTLFAFTGDGWTRLAPMPEERAAGGAAIVNGKLYVVGGTTGSTIGAPTTLAKRMLVYDIARDRWTSRRGPTPREHLGVTALGGKIYAVCRPDRRFRYEHASGGGLQPQDRPLVPAPACARQARRDRRGRNRTLDRVGRRRGDLRDDPHRLPLRREAPSLVEAAEPPHCAARARSRRGRRKGVRDRRWDEPRALRQPSERVSGGSIGSPGTTTRRPPVW